MLPFRTASLTAFVFTLLFAVGSAGETISAEGAEAVLSAEAAALPPSDRDLVIQALDDYRHGNCQDAEPLFEKILLDQPKDIATRKLLANCYLQDKKMDEAKVQFQLVLEVAPQDMEAFQGLKASMTEIQNKTLLKQKLALESRAVTAEEYRSSHEMEEAEKLLKAHQLAAAEKILDGIVSRHPNSVPACEHLAEIYSTTRRFDKAALMYEGLAKYSPQFLLRAAENLEWGKNYSEAADYYRFYLQKNPNSSSALMAMARISMQNQDYIEGAHYYRLYLEKNPQDNEARLVLAEMLMWSGHYNEAALEFERLIAARPKDPSLRLSLAQCYQQLEQKDKALDAYQQVLDLDPSNPAALKARSEYLHYFDELPRQQAYAALGRNDLDGAVRYFIQYSEKHPENTEMLLQIARVYSWAKHYPEAEKYYEAYLQLDPRNAEIMRELASLEMGNKQYTEARRQYELLTQGPQARPEDYEALLHAYTWSGDLEGAQPVAQKVLQLEPKNADALQVLSDLEERKRVLAEQKRLGERTHAEELAEARRYPEAVAAYRQYMADYGHDQQMELLIPRLYSWGKDYAESEKSYRSYLAEYPNDSLARLELANVENWAGNYQAAESDYRAVLQQDPHQVDALVGIAQVVDYEQKDPFEVRDEFVRALQADPKNAIAEKRLAEMRPLVDPSLTFNEDAFADTDGVFRTVSSVEVSFPLPGRVKLTPFYNFGYFHQDVSSLDLRDYGEGGGARIEVSRASGLSFLAELGGVYWTESEKIGTSRFQTNRESFYARGEASYRLPRNSTLGFSYVHKDAVYDLTTIQALAAGIMEDTAMVTYQRPLSERFQLWATSGFSHFTPGTLTSQYSNTEFRFSASLNYQLKPWVSLGYATRISGFSSASPIYFSPPLYQTHGLDYKLSKQVFRNFYISADGEFDYGRIGTHQLAVPIGVSSTVNGVSVNSFEMAAVPGLKWRLPHAVTVQAGLRLTQGLGGSSTHGPSTLYRTGGGQLNVVKVF
jgi:tetratricopeptide (TPR) repeat protein